MEIILLLFIAYVVYSWVSGTFQRKGQWTTAFETLAQRYGGYFQSASAIRKPAATFSYKDAMCRVRCRQIGGRRGNRQTDFRITWRSQNVKLEVIKDYGLARIRSLRSAQPLSVGEPEFWQNYYVFCTDPQYADKFLSDGVRWQIQQLSQFIPETDSVYIKIEKGALTIAKKGYIKSTQVLDDFVRYCLELFDQMMLTQSEGIEFNDDTVAAVTDMQCPVCSSDVEGQMVICVRCKTPHCLDCWQYNAQCGMFACGEKRYTLIGQAQHNPQA